MAQKIPMTKVGYDRLRAEVERLKQQGMLGQVFSCRLVLVQVN